MRKKILIVDDDADFREELRDFLEGYDAVEASSGLEALKLLERANDIGLVILDVMMPGLTGTEILGRIKKIDPGLKIIILTGHSSKDVAIEALKGHADDYIEKPIDINKIKEVIDRLSAGRAGEGAADAVDTKGKILKIKQFIEENCYKKINLKDAAEFICLSPKYISRVFRNTMGIGFSEYKLKVKIGKARELLAKSGYNVNQISDKLGYENAESFIRQFKKFTGCTPTGYRKKILKKKRRKSKRG